MPCRMALDVLARRVLSAAQTPADASAATLCTGGRQRCPPSLTVRGKASVCSLLSPAGATVVSGGLPPDYGAGGACSPQISA